jgi:uncharacterized Fe-S cluster-containing radical SAM superfamily enzyme
MKHIVKLDKGKYIHLDSYGEPRAHHLQSLIESLIGFSMVLGISIITVGAMLGTDVTKLIQMPNHSTQPAQPLKP